MKKGFSKKTLIVIIVFALTAVFLFNSDIYASNLEIPIQLKQCGCLEYVQNVKNLPKTNGAAGADTYASWLKKKGYTVTFYTPKTNSPSTLVGKLMVWKRGAKGSNSANGHIAVVKAVSYDAKAKKWTFKFIGANWSEGSLQKDSICNNVRLTTKVYSNVDGLTFFTAKKN